MVIPQLKKLIELHDNSIQERALYKGIVTRICYNYSLGTFVGRSPTITDVATLWQTKACVCICIPLLALDRICKGQSDAKSITNSFTSFTIIQQLQFYFPLANRIMIIIASGSKGGMFCFWRKQTISSVLTPLPTEAVYYVSSCLW